MHAANLMNVPHFSGHIGMNRLFDFGYVGVDFFFTLSGFIITFVHYQDIGRAGSVPRYLWRRVSRIYPIYWFILALVIAITVAGRLATGKPAHIDLQAADWASTVLLIPGSGEPKYVGVAWSLQYEVAFYVIFCVVLLHARVGAMLLSAWAVFLLGGVMDLWRPALPLNLGSAHCIQFLLGICAAVIARRWGAPASIPPLVFSVLAFVGATVFELFGPFLRHSSMGRVALGLSSAIVLLALAGLEQGRALRTPRWLVSIGSVSYSIYLGHIVFISVAYMALAKLGLYHRLPESVVYVVGVAVAVACTFLIGKWVELPLVAQLKGLGSRVGTVPSLAAKG